MITVCPLPGTQEYGGLTVIEGKSISIVGGDDPDRIVLNGKDAGSTIRVADGSLTLENLTITGGTGTLYTSTGPEGLGGGVDAACGDGPDDRELRHQGQRRPVWRRRDRPWTSRNAETLILDSQLSDNIAYWGGGAYLQWGGQIIGTGIYRNDSDLAGGVFSGANTLTVTASVISENTSRETVSGGGALIYDGLLRSEDSDWGQGDTNNTRNDVMLANTRTDKYKSYTDKTAGETFSCDASVPSCS
ncbi:MAG: hypothetical protein IPI35_07165 [Deltaproteobacteria bacterium]|nr:hypothetical protein [Deltaproteobacteria bacterium]